MSLKADILVMGAVGAGIYIVATNAGKISAWLGDQIGRGIVSPAQEIINKNVTEPIYNAGVAAGTATREAIIEPIFNAGVAAGTATREAIIEPIFNAGVATGTAVKAANTALVASTSYEQEAALKGVATFGLGTIPVVGPILSGLFSWLTPPAQATNREIIASVINAGLTDTRRFSPSPASPSPAYTTGKTYQEYLAEIKEQMATETPPSEPSQVAPTQADSELRAWIDVIIPPGGVRGIGTGTGSGVGGIAGIFYNPTALGYVREGLTFWAQVAGVQNTTLYNIEDIYNPIVRRALEKEIAERGGMNVRAE